MSLHYNAEQFMDHFQRRALGVDISFAVEDSPLGTGGAIKNCEPHLRASRSFIFNGDIFTNLSLRDMLAEHQSAGARVSIALKEVDDPSRYGVIETNADGRVHSFTEKPPRELAKSRDINAGIYIFERDVFDHFPDGACSVERDVFPRLLEQAKHLHGYREACYWTDLGTPGDYLQAHRDILHGRVTIPIGCHEVYPGIWTGTNAEIADEAFIRPPVMLGSGVRVEAGATVGPMVVLGESVRIGEEALVEDSVIWERTNIMPQSYVQGCIIGREACIAGQIRGTVCEDAKRIAC
jgi:mannose-1-phosphate guanylyltransferase